MGVRRLGIVMNGVTGRMGTNQHLIRSIVAIRNQGGVVAGPGLLLWPEPLLVGRDEGKLRALAAALGLEDAYTTDLDGALADPDYEVYFDAQVTSRRADALFVSGCWRSHCCPCWSSFRFCSGLPSIAGMRGSTPP